MKKLRDVLAITGYNLRYFTINPKNVSAVVIILTIIISSVEGYAQFARDYNSTVSIGIISGIFSNNRHMLIFLAMLFVFSELPFRNPQQIMVVTRSGKRAWYLSQLVYIIVISVAVTLLISLVTMLVLAGHLSFEDDWGKIIRSGTFNSELSQKYMLTIGLEESILKTQTPYSAILLSLSVATLEFIFFGTLVFALNMITGRIVGVVVGLVLIILDQIIIRINNNWIFYVSPITWVPIEYIGISHEGNLPPPEYVYTMLLGMYALLVVPVFFHSRKKRDIL